MANSLVKLHRNNGDVKPRPNLRGWDLAQGSLVYTGSTRGQIGQAFRNAANFVVYDNSFNQSDSTAFYVVWGTYEGKTERFDTMNYLHQRAAMNAGFGKTGNDKLDKVWGVVSAAANWQETLARAVINPKTKYFVGFFSKCKTEPSHIMHNQTDVASLSHNGLSTLAQIFHKYRQMFM